MLDRQLLVIKQWGARLLLMLCACCGAIAAQAQSNYEPYSFTTLASGFTGPEGVAVDVDGNVYVAVAGENTIRKITPTGFVTTLAGTSGLRGSIDGSGSAARFDTPIGVAVDPAGTVYVLDSGNHTFRKITPGGTVTTVAGRAGTLGSTDGTGGAARFKFPEGVAVDRAGTVYVADTFNSTIRKITPDGVVSTLAGLAGSVGHADGTGSAARFNYPFGIAVDSAGNLFVADSRSNHTIRKITPDGVVTTLAGLAGTPGSADGTGGAARFNEPYGVAIDSADNLYVADSVNNTIRKITPAGVVTTLAGLTGTVGSADGTGSAARFDFPVGVAVDGAVKVYVGDFQNNTIRVGRPAAGPPAALGNISTRLRVETADNVLIGGFIVTGTQPKKVIIRGIGTSLPFADKLANPTLELHGPNGLIESNDNWVDSPNKQAIMDSTIPPSSDLESAIVQTLPANNADYTAIVRGVNGGTGLGVVEAYDLDRTTDSKLANISTRGLVQTGDNVLIAGTIILGQNAQKVIVRAIGPSLPIAGRMENPTLELRDQNGGLIEANDNWVDSPNKQAIIETTIPPSNDLESAIVATLPSNNASYTAIVRGVNDTTGIAVVEVYALN